MKKLLIGALVVCAVVAIAYAAPGLKAAWFEYQPQASNPVTAGRPGVYFQTDADMGTFVAVHPGGQSQAIGSGSGDIEGITVTSPIAGGGTSGTVNISHANVGPGAGSCTFCSITSDAQGHVSARSSGAPVTSVTCGTGLAGGTITTTGTCSIGTAGLQTAYDQDADGSVNLLGTGTKPITANMSNPSSFVGIPAFAGAASNTATVGNPSYAGLGVGSIGSCWDTDNGVARLTSNYMVNVPISSTTCNSRIAFTETSSSGTPVEVASITPSTNTFVNGSRTLNMGGGSDGHVLTLSGSTIALAAPASGGTMQSAYDGGSNVTLNGTQLGIDLTCYSGQTAPALSVAYDSLGNTQFAGLKTSNATAAVSGSNGQNAPGMLFAGNAYRGNTPTGNQPDQWFLGPQSALTVAEDTAHYSFLHSYDGSNFVHGMQITLQDCFPNCTNGEVILNTLQDDYFLIYPKTAPTDGHGVTGFFGTNGQAVVWGTSLTGRRMRFDATNGQSPASGQDVLIDLGQIDAATLRYRKIAGRVTGAYTVETAADLPENSYGVEVDAVINATSGNQKHSPAFHARGRGYDTAGAASRICDVYEQLVPVQETGAPPTINYNWSTKVATVNATSQVRMTLRSGTADDTDGGELVTGHYCGMGAAPGIAAGAAAGSGPTASVAGTDAGGVITITMGTSTTTGTLATVTFANAWYAGATGLAVILTPADSDSAALGFGAYVNQASTSATQFVITAGSAPTASTEYRWHYWTVGK